MANWSTEKKEALRVMVENGATRDELISVMGVGWEAVQKSMKRMGLEYKQAPDFNVKSYEDFLKSIKKAVKPKCV